MILITASILFITMTVLIVIATLMTITMIVTIARPTIMKTNLDDGNEKGAQLMMIDAANKMRTPWT